jgi:hypothetical protein
MRVPVIVPCTLCCKLSASSYWLIVNVPKKLFPFGPWVTFSLMFAGPIRVLPVGFQAVAK